MIRRATFLIAAVIAICCVSGLAHAQRGSNYPFFVQPMTVQNVRALADRLELSRDQRRVLLEQYEAYNQRFEDLQEGDVADYMDAGIDTVMRVQPWGGDFQIPSREEVTKMVSEGLAIIRSFGKIDDTFFDDITPLLSETQFIRLEQSRRFRALDRYGMLHRNMVGAINEGASPDLIGIMRRVEVEPEIQVQVDEVLSEYAKRTIAGLRSFESAGKELIEALLDELDTRGIRDMDMMAMMEYFASEERQNELKSLFDPLTRPIQGKAAILARENLRAYRALIVVLPPDAARDVRTRFVRKGYRQADQGVSSSRSSLVRLRELDLSEDINAEVDAVIVQLDEKYDTLLSSMLSVINTQRKFRSIEQLEGDVPLEGADRLEGLEARRSAIESAATAVLERHQDALALAKHEEAEEKSAGGGQVDELSESQTARKMIKLQPIDADQIKRLGQWMGADDSGLELIVILHTDYETSAEALLLTHGRSAFNKKKDFDFEADRAWRNWQSQISEIQQGAGVELGEIEAELFADMALALPDSVDRMHIDRIRKALLRSRRRAAIAEDSWSMRRHTEAVIDLTAITLDTDPTTLDLSQRAIVLKTLLEYDDAVERPLEEFKDRAAKVKKLEQRMWGGDEYEPEVRQAIRSKWEKRQQEVGETMKTLAMLNRDHAQRVYEQLPHDASWAIRDAYDRQAFPRIFEDGRAADEAIEAVMELELTPDQQRRAEDLASGYRESWRGLTAVMVDRRKEGSPQMTFPPTREAMSTELDLAQIKYRRAQLDQRMLAQLELLLDPAQSAMIPALQLTADAQDSDR